MLHYSHKILKNIIKLAPRQVKQSSAVDRLRKLIRIFSYIRRIGLNQLIWTIDTVEFKYGHFLSYEKKNCVDSSENPIPWYTYPAIEYLKQLDFSDKEIYEYGAGNSSLFWASRAKSVISVEHDREWYLKIQKQQPVNQKIFLIDNEDEYVKFIEQTHQNYDLIVIDGMARLACAKVAVQSLAKGGLIILDNSDWYPETTRYLRESGLIQIDFKGLGPINYYTWTTSLFLRRDVNLKPRSQTQPEPGIASLVQTVNPE